MSENNGNSNLPVEQDPPQTEIVPADDVIYLRMLGICNGIMNFYDMVVTAPPEQAEEFFAKHPKVAEARMKIAPIAIARILPVKKEIKQGPLEPHGKRITTAELLKTGVGKLELKRLAGIEDT